ncbi:MAG: polysaccharide deacetylase family protein [Burkholderiales bacterium]|nr:polysaccharide deacetylase family protein [Burkholderiales bacterium]
MRVILSFDVELWCNGWDRLDQNFPGSFERYVYGRSARGDYALPKTLEIMNRHGLKGVFFVEPLFAARFGEQHLRTIVELIQSAGQEVQLHLHPEWTDEIRPPLIANVQAKRQHLSMYTLDEQVALIGHGKRALEAITGRAVTAFRAGSFAANRDTFEALARCGITIDSSLNDCYAVSGPDVARPPTYQTQWRVGPVVTYPVTVFRDGFGRARSAQVNGCGLGELAEALASAVQGGCGHFVIVSHNFEMLKPDRSDPDDRVVRRFERLCALLGARYEVGSYPQQPAACTGERQPTVGTWSTGRRYVEQALRRLM